ncbi:MAG: hypothetical protein IKM47_06455 [Bacteroidaceae bacterium]|nr:hypothetical protein [Bacteroidaceae bacterium]
MKPLKIFARQWKEATMNNKPILDACCGGKIIGKQNAEVIPAWSLHRLIELYKDVEDISLWSLEFVNYNRLIQCISLAIKHGAFNKEYLKQ